MTCIRCGAGPYQSLHGWNNHISIHREMDLLADDRAKVALRPWIEIMDEQDRLVQAKAKKPRR